MPTLLLLAIPILLLLLLLTNAKSLPFMYSLRLLPSLYRIIRPRLSRNPQPKAATTTTPHPLNHPKLFYPALTQLFHPHTTQTHCALAELDLNLHKSNSTFFTDADLSRARLLSHLLGPALATISGGGKTPAMPILAAVQARFLREIRPFQRYAVRTRILAWDRRSLFTVTYFLREDHGEEERANDLGMMEVDVLGGGPAAVLRDDKLRKRVLAVLVSRYVVKAGRVTVPPVEVFKRAGLLVCDDEEDDDVGHSKGDRATFASSAEEEKEEDSLVRGGSKNCSSIKARNHPKDSEEVWSADRVEEVIGSAMAFIGECML
ncbi:hypothetical protein BO78DRAFT_441723 [Aspergillus sclerotiicarbonarius CBS 121057]|uniref:Capsule polysaccharide biosynthesis protein n=1 Tax=Aspergillus sclerotiicarbonarius (strain CBS 121057 / IBT 28362) TaxID=1448318 RepID=A0A319EFL7_ASPSB|nr:hypothetical protein BO78DRAFT_441723 [Aspergillus sclerotiicarbonarius CBS 121057]